MAKIGIDVDGVLAHFDEAFSEVGRELFGKRRIPQGYVPHDWNWTDVITMDEQNLMWKEVKEKVNFWTKLKPFEENVFALRDFLMDYGKQHDVWFVTARAQSAGDSIAHQTRRWLNGQLNTADSLHRGVVTVAKPPLKRQVLEGMGITYMIDDHGPTIAGLESLEGMNACLLDSPWNQDTKVKTRVQSMAEFLYLIEPKLTRWEKRLAMRVQNLTQENLLYSGAVFNTSHAQSSTSQVSLK